MRTMLSKFSNTVVLNLPNTAGCILHNPDFDTIETLDEFEENCWNRWEIKFTHDKLNSLLTKGFIVPKVVNDDLNQFEDFNLIVPCIDSIYIKWYFESPELAVLFCTKQMSENNPLLVLNSYGSLCWKGILEKRTIKDIRLEAIRIFGIDEVVYYLKRLEGLGFIKPIPHIDCNYQEYLSKEISAPTIQFKLQHTRIPWYCLWEVCMKCNYRCKICYLPHFKTSGPESEDALNIAQQIIDSGIFYVCLLGGEPLIRNDLELIVKKLRSHGVFVKIITNGHLLTYDRAQKFFEAGLNQIEVSFDGLSKLTHDFSRGENTFGHAVDAISTAIKAKIPRIAVVWTIHSGNLHEIDSLPNFLLNVNVKECYISVFKKTGLNGSKAPFEPLTYVEVENIKKKLSNYECDYPDIKITLLPTCSCGHTSIVIGDNGDVRLCSFSYYSIGNIYEKPLLKLWNPNAEITFDNSAWGYCEANHKSTPLPLLSTCER